MPKDNRTTKRFLRSVFVRLYTTFGPQHWWPAESPFEVAVGAILTQNTNWKNVEKAINNLKERGLLSPERLYHLDKDSLARLIRPAGYFNIKAERLKSFIKFLIEEFDGKMENMHSCDLQYLRSRLLHVDGIGPETADSILLYALNRPIFVVDAYTKRFLIRHGIIESKADYSEIQSLFHHAIEPDPAIYNEYHALLVRLGKEFCKPKPLCEDCPVKPIGK